MDTQKELNILAFIEESIAKVEAQGYRYILMRGDAEEFVEQGFVKSKAVNIDFGKSDAGDWLVKDLSPNAGNAASGTVNLPEYMK